MPTREQLKKPLTAISALIRQVDRPGNRDNRLTDIEELIGVAFNSPVTVISVTKYEGRFRVTIDLDKAPNFDDTYHLLRDDRASVSDS